MNQIEATLYKLKRLQSGLKSFSDGTKSHRIFGIRKAIKDVTTGYLADTAMTFTVFFILSSCLLNQSRLLNILTEFLVIACL